MTIEYNDPYGGTPSSVGTQINQWYYEKKALIEAAKEQPFGQLASTISMPRNMGKTIKRYHYLPILDDANLTDQGINAAGVSTTLEITFTFVKPGAVDTGNGWVGYSVVGEGSSSANAITNAKAKAKPLLQQLGATWTTDYATTRAALIAAGWTIHDDTSTPARVAVPESSNLYGSSKDIGLINSKMPRLAEDGGRVNRVGMTRIQLESSLEKYGFFTEYTEESMLFDTDAELQQHVTSEMVKAANEINEDLIQMDLLNSAGVIYYGGTATSVATVNGNTGSVSSINYADLLKAEVIMDTNRCPKHTTVITGSRLIDTKTVRAARYIYIGSELVNSVRSVTDTWGNPAFISVEKYSDASTVVHGEIGAIGGFRFIVAQEMMHWAAAGAAVTTNAGYRTSLDSGGTEKYNVYPMLMVGDESFTTVGFQTDGKSTKFKIKHVKPGDVESYDKNDPYGQLGFMSIMFYYGFMVLRPERILLFKVVAPY